MPQVKHQLVNDDPDYDLDPYYADTQDKSEKDNWWLMSVAGLLGAAFATSSLRAFFTLLHDRKYKDNALARIA